MGRIQYLEAGEIVGTHGIRGEVRVQPWCDSAEQLCRIKTFYWDKDGRQSVKAQARPHKNIALVALDGVTTVEAAEALRGRMLYAHRDDFRLPKGRYFVCDLLGLAVVDADTGVTYGTLCDVSQTGANPVYHVKTDKGEVLLPAVPSIVKTVDIDGGEIRITPIKGLFDDAD
ncbi:MAG: 16S rRNA processing protein RimM [Clostridia bacterium]|nr:16S rRNA processing protein RimM [Clostridia bacterium]